MENSPNSVGEAMLLGVPVFTIAYKLTSQITHDRLKRKEIEL